MDLVLTIRLGKDKYDHTIASYPKLNGNVPTASLAALQRGKILVQAFARFYNAGGTDVEAYDVRSSIDALIDTLSTDHSGERGYNYRSLPEEFELLHTSGHDFPFAQNIYWNRKTNKAIVFEEDVFVDEMTLDQLSTYLDQNEIELSDDEILRHTGRVEAEAQD